MMGLNWERGTGQSRSLARESVKTVFNLRYLFLGDLKFDRITDVTPLMGKFETNDCVWKNQIVFAYLAVKANVELEGTKPIVTIRYTDKGSERIWALIWGNGGKIEGR